MSLHDEVPRDYQSTAAGRALSTNTIVVLPTNSGKTLIPVLLFREILPEVKEKGQKIGFVAPLRALLLQQVEYIKLRLPARTTVATFTGDSVIETKAGNLQIDDWSEEDWRDQVANSDVLFMIPEIFCQALLKANLHSRQFGLVVFDECHHCTASHPMNRICASLRDQEYRGRILGLTASPKKKKKGSLESTIFMLEQNMNSRVFMPEHEMGCGDLVTAKPSLMFLRHDESHLRLHCDHKWLEESYDKLRRCCTLHHLRASMLTLQLTDENFQELLDAPHQVMPRGGWATCKPLEATQELLGQLLQVLCDNGLACGLSVLAMTLSDQSDCNAGTDARARIAQQRSAGPGGHNKRLSNLDVPQLKKLHEELRNDPQDLTLLTNGPAVCFEALVQTLAFFAVSLGPAVCARARPLVTSKLQAQCACVVSHDAVLVVLDAVLVQGDAASVQTIALPGDVPDIADVKRALALTYKVLFDSIPDRSLISSIFAVPTGASPPTLEPVSLADPLSFDACLSIPHIAADFVVPDRTAPFPLCSKKLAAFFRLWLMLPEQVLERRSKKIVFVKTRLTALSLCELVRKVMHSKCFTGLVAGHNTFPFVATEVLLGSSDIKEQSAVLFRFKHGQSNILFSTDVAEEGLDIPTCKMVLHYDSPPSAKSLIQRHGRARDAKSLAVFIADRGDAGRHEMHHVEGLLDQQRQLGLQTSTATELSSWEAHQEIKMPLPQAISLLVQFCMLLPKDVYFDPTPIFDFAEIEEDPHGPALDTASLSSITASAIGGFGQLAVKGKLFVCSILLPASIRPEIRCVVGRPSPSKSDAKGNACLACLENLRRHGELDDSHRFTADGVTKNSRKTSRRRVMAEALVDMRRRVSPVQADAELTMLTDQAELLSLHDPAGSDYQISPALVSLDCKAVPDCLVCDPVSDMEELFFYRLDCVAPSTGFVTDALAELGIAYQRPLPEDIVDQPLSFSFRGHVITATLVAQGSRRVSPAELALLQAFHLSVACWTALSEAGMEALPWSRGEWSQSSGGSYYIVLPTPPSDSGIEDPQYWETFLPACLSEAQTLMHNLAQYRSDNVEIGVDQGGHLELEYESGDFAAAQHDAPQAGHEAGHIFARGSFDLWVALPSPSSDDSSLSPPFFDAEYVSSRLILTNLIKTRVPTQIYSDRPRWRKTLSRTTCRWMGKKKWLNFGLAAPSVLFRINSLCLALEARDCILDHMRDAACPLFLRAMPPARLLPALTLSRCGEDVSLERLEMLGDTLFKFFLSVELFRRHPDDREGALTQMRSEWISNSFQAERAVDLGLSKFLRYIPLVSGRRMNVKPPGLGGGPRYHPLGTSLWSLKLTASKALLYGPAPALLPLPLLSPPDDVLGAADEDELDAMLLGDGNQAEEEGGGQEEDEEQEQEQEEEAEGALPTVKAKCLADMMEAILAAFYLNGGLEDVLKVMQGLQMLPALHLTPSALAALDVGEVGGAANRGIPREIVIDSLPPVRPVNIPPNFPLHLKRLALDTGEAATGGSALGIGRLDAAKQHLSIYLGYKFVDVAILDMALTHCSVHHKPSNQRLEWLGDAVLDLVVVDYLYQKHPAADEGELSALKQEAVCNARLASCAVRLGLHTMLQHRTETLGQHLSQLSDESFFGGPHVPVPPACVKVLADAFEAVVGAVYVDSSERMGLRPILDIVLQLQLVRSAEDLHF